MKTFKLFAVLGSAAIFLAQPLFAAGDFEGRVDFKVTTDRKNEPHAFKYFIKGDTARMEWEGTDKESRGTGAMIIDNGSKTMKILMPEQKQYMEMPMQEAEDMAEEAQKEDKRQFTKTGKTETILGYPCEQYISKSDDSETEIWATKKLGHFYGFQRGRGKGLSAWQKKLMKEGFFPMKVHERTSTGKDKSSWEVTAIEKKSLSKDLFQPPADYAKLEMPQMPAGMKDFKNMFKKGSMGGREN